MVGVARRKPVGAMVESDLKTKLMAGAGLVCVSTTLMVLYKASQKAMGGFKYSTLSAICMAEFLKFVLSCSFHVADASHRKSGVHAAQTAFQVASNQLSFAAVTQILLLSALYTVNNQITFFVSTLMDPGTIFLFKSASTIITATVQCTCAGKSFTRDQWKAMALQACGMVIIQYDVCRGAGMYAPVAYCLMGFSTVITACSAARNEFLVKNYSIGLNIQNAVLYFGGCFLNYMGFLLAPILTNMPEKGFFEGYDNPLAIGVVLSNAFIGLAITAVYKHADAVVKCFAGDITAVLLIIISACIFGLKTNLTMWCGIFVVMYAVHSYIDASRPPAKKEDVSISSSIKNDEVELGASQETSSKLGKSRLDDAKVDDVEPFLQSENEA